MHSGQPVGLLNQKKRSASLLDIEKLVRAQFCSRPGTYSIVVMNSCRREWDFQQVLECELTKELMDEVS